jgi:hypothetical protein
MLLVAVSFFLCSIIRMLSEMRGSLGDGSSRVKNKAQMQKFADSLYWIFCLKSGA